MSEKDFDEFAKGLKTKWAIAIIFGALVLFGSNLLAGKLFYTESLENYGKRITSLEQRRRIDDSLTQLRLWEQKRSDEWLRANVKNICEKMGVKYIEP